MRYISKTWSPNVVLSDVGLHLVKFWQDRILGSQRRIQTPRVRKGYFANAPPQVMANLIKEDNTQ
eukprot:6240149-Amphidinium_carterae.1